MGMEATLNQLRDALRQLADVQPIDLAFSLLSQNILLSFFLAILPAFVLSAGRSKQA